MHAAFLWCYLLGNIHVKDREVDGRMTGGGSYEGRVRGSWNWLKIVSSGVLWY